MSNLHNLLTYSIGLDSLNQTARVSRLAPGHVKDILSPISTPTVFFIMNTSVVGATVTFLSSMVVLTET